MSRSIILALCLLCTAVQAANPLFGAYMTGECEACLDQTYESCPGDYQTRPYAMCMCGGDGGANFVSCLPYCPAGNDETRIASEAYYGYCVKFIKELCEVAQEVIDEETYAEQCSKEAIAAGGIGADEDEDSEKSEKEEPSKTNETAQTTSGANPTAIPALAVMAGLGLQLMYG